MDSLYPDAHRSLLAAVSDQRVSMPYSVKVLSKNEVEWLAEGEGSGGLSAVFSFTPPEISIYSWVPVRPGELQIWFCVDGNLLPHGAFYLYPRSIDGRVLWRMAGQAGEVLLDVAGIVAWTVDRLDRTRSGCDEVRRHSAPK